MDVKIEESWKHALAPEFEKPYFRELARQLHEEKRFGRTIYPPAPLIFSAFNLTPLPQVKVVIIGQDPYHGPGQAEGLSFSVPHGIPLLPSLVNIYKEIESDLGVQLHKDGSLRGWAEQGVFLLNAVLTVRAGQPASHSQIGWTVFTDGTAGRARLFALGQFRPFRKNADRHVSAHRAGSSAPLAAGPRSFLRLPSFFPSQQDSGPAGEKPG